MVSYMLAWQNRRDGQITARRLVKDERVALDRMLPKFDNPSSFIIGLAGAIYMLLLAFNVLIPPKHEFIGTRLYDLYTLALLHSRFDLPFRELLGEGHYSQDGTGYLYHGLGPVLTRLPLLPFVNFPVKWMASLSIWFWAVSGNLCYHRIFQLAFDRAPFKDEVLFSALRPLLGFLIWFGSPGLLLVANTSLFYEPVAMAYALGGGFMLLIVRIAFREMLLVRALLPLSLLAGLTVHARPHLAVGYYAAVCLLTAVAVLRRHQGARKRAAAAMLVLGLFGGILIGSNVLRFKSTTMMHGSFAKGELQYGMVFWGAEPADSERARSFEEHGRFAPTRILPNSLMYFAAPPGANSPLHLLAEAAFRNFQPWTGYVRVEEPSIGILFLWPFWTLLMMFGLRRRVLWRTPAVAGLLAASIATMLLLSYATITLRYHIDIWPLIALPAAFGVAPLSAWLATRAQSAKLIKGTMLVVIVLGTLTTAVTVQLSRAALQDPYGVLSKDECLKLTARRGFSASRSAELCWLDSEPGV